MNHQQDFTQYKGGERLLWKIPHFYFHSDFEGYLVLVTGLSVEWLSIPI